MFIKLSTGSITISDEGLKGLTRKNHAHLSDEDFEIVQKIKDERFPPVIKKPKDAEPSTGG
jgi:hypothetical protein